MILNFFRFLFCPRWWIMVDSYSEKWDRELNILLDKYRFTDITRYTAKLGTQGIWIANHPYGSFRPYENFHRFDIRPKRSTILRAYKILMEDRQLAIESRIIELEHDEVKKWMN
jgi:hypothetical protein